MTPRIETAELLSFRLKVPPAELYRLPDKVRPELRLAIEEDAGEVVLSREDSDSYVRFRPIGTEAMLTEVFLCNDEHGLFFSRVVAALMVRFGGDLHVRLIWNVAELNTQGEYAEVRISRGSTQVETHSPGLAERTESGEVAFEAEPAEAPVGSANEREVQELLAKARAYWQQYQRAKGRKR